MTLEQRIIALADKHDEDAKKWFDKFYELDAEKVRDKEAASIAFNLHRCFAEELRNALIEQTMEVMLK